MTIDKPGIFFDLPAEEYFADPCPSPSLSQSIAKILLDQSPLHAKTEHPRLTPPVPGDEDEEKYTAAKAIGNAAHKILIGRGKEIALAPWSDWRSKEARAFRSHEKSLGREPVLEKHVVEAQTIAMAAKRQLADAGWADAFADGKGNGEVVLAWQEDEIWFRTMIDWLPRDMLAPVDLKTGGVSFAPHDLGRKMAGDGWDIQAAMHERALDALDTENAGRRKFRFIAIENYPPYALVPIEMTEAWLVMGRKKLDHAIAIWRECMRTGSFPSYGADIVQPEYPGYAEAQWLDREIKQASHARMPVNILAAG